MLSFSPLELSWLPIQERNLCNHYLQQLLALALESLCPSRFGQKSHSESVGWEDCRKGWVQKRYSEQTITWPCDRCMRRGNDNRDLLPWRHAAARTHCTQEKKVKGVVFKKFLYLYTRIWSHSAQNRKEFSLNPIQGCAPVSTRTLCFVQGCYWMLASSSPRMVRGRWWWWSHGRGINKTCLLHLRFRICSWLLFMSSFSAHRQRYQILQSVIHQFYSR